MSEIVVLTRDELQSTIKTAVLQALHEAKKSSIKPDRQNFTTEQAVEYLNTDKGYKIARNTLYKLIHDGMIPSYKRGGRVWFKRSELDAWVEERTDISKAQKRATEALSRSASNQLSERRE